MLNKEEKIIIPIFILAGVILLTFSIYGMSEKISFKESAYKTNGIVIELEERRKSNGASRTYSPIVEYQDHKGIKQNLHPNSSSNPPAFYIGENVTVLLDTDDPNYKYTAEIDSFSSLYGAYFITGALGSAFFISSLVLFFIRKSKNVKKT